MEIKKGQNMIEHEEEIFSRPKKTWFTSAKAKQEAKGACQMMYHLAMAASNPILLFLIIDLSKQEYLSASQSKGSAKDKAPDPSAPKRDKFSGLSRRQKRRKMAAEADKELNDKGAVNSAIRAAKHAQRPRKIGEDAPQPSFAKKKNKKDSGKGKKPGHASAKTKVLGKDSKFKAEMGAKRRGGGGRATEGIRAKKGDGGILGGKKSGKGGGKGKTKGRR